MRITIDIPDEIHARLKPLAKAEKTTMRAIVLRGIAAVLESEKYINSPTRPTEQSTP